MKYNIGMQAAEGGPALRFACSRFFAAAALTQTQVSTAFSY